MRQQGDSCGAAIATKGGQLVIHHGKATEVLEALPQSLGTFDLWSHQETGNGWTFERDRDVKAWATVYDIPWHERRQFGVQRGREQNRDLWAKRWDRMMQAPLAEVPAIGWAPPLPSDPLPESCAMAMGLSGSSSTILVTA